MSKTTQKTFRNLLLLFTLTVVSCTAPADDLAKSTSPETTSLIENMPSVRPSTATADPNTKTNPNTNTTPNNNPKSSSNSQPDETVDNTENSTLPFARLYSYNTDAETVEQTLPARTGNNSQDAAITAYRELLNGERGFYTDAPDGFYTNAGANMLKDIFENFVAAQATDDGYDVPGYSDYRLKYAFLDCGSDGSMELAVSLCLDNYFFFIEETYILQYDDKTRTIQAIYSFGSFPRADHDLYSDGYLEYESTGSAENWTWDFEVLDGNGHPVRIFSCDTEPHFDKETYDILHAAAIEVFGGDSKMLLSFSYDKAVDAYDYNEWAVPKLYQYYLGDTSYIWFEYFDESASGYDADMALKTEQYNTLLAERGINIMLSAASTKRENGVKHQQIIADLKKHSEYTAREPLKWYGWTYLLPGKNMAGNDMEAAEALLAANLAVEEFAWGEWGELIHPEKGAVFVPFSHIDYNSQQVLFPDQIRDYEEDTNIYNWGTIDNTDEEILLSMKDYFAQYVYDQDYRYEAQIAVNGMIRTGNAAENLREVFPDAIFVEYHYAGTEEKEYLDWTSLKIVLEKYQDSYKIVAFIHSRYSP